MKKLVFVVMPGYHNTVHEFCNQISKAFDINLILPKHELPLKTSRREYNVTPLPSYSVSEEMPLAPSLIPLIRKEKPALIITGEDFQPNTLMLFLSKPLLDAPIVVINHKYFFSRISYLKPLHKLVLKFLTRPLVWAHSRKIVVRTSAALKFAVENGASRSKIEFIPMGITPRKVTDFNKLKGKNEVIRVLTVGRLIPLKGIEHIVSAVGELANEGRKVTLTIVGDGPLGDSLREQVQKEGIEDNVQFIKHIKHENLLDAYSKYDVYVQASKVEVIGFAALEALAAGRALIVTNVGGLRDLVADGTNGYKLPPENPRAIARSIRDLCENPSKLREMQAASLRRAKEIFAWEVVRNQYVELINKCIARTNEAM